MVPHHNPSGQPWHPTCCRLERFPDGDRPGGIIGVKPIRTACPTKLWLPYWDWLKTLQYKKPVSVLWFDFHADKRAVSSIRPAHQRVRRVEKIPPMTVTCFSLVSRKPRSSGKSRGGGRTSKSSRGRGKGGKGNGTGGRARGTGRGKGNVHAGTADHGTRDGAEDAHRPGNVSEEEQDVDEALFGACDDEGGADLQGDAAVPDHLAERDNPSDWNAGCPGDGGEDSDGSGGEDLQPLAVDGGIESYPADEDMTAALEASIVSYFVAEDNVPETPLCPPAVPIEGGGGLMSDAFEEYLFADGDDPFSSPHPMLTLTAATAAHPSQPSGSVGVPCPSLPSVGIVGQSLPSPIVFGEMLPPPAVAPPPPAPFSPAESIRSGISRASSTGDLPGRKLPKCVVPVGSGRIKYYATTNKLVARCELIGHKRKLFLDEDGHQTTQCKQYWPTSFSTSWIVGMLVAVGTCCVEGS